jgi:hypothetical protein
MPIVLDIILVLLILAVLQPFVRQRMLEAARVRLLKSIEAKRGTRVIVMIHREEILALLAPYRYIGIDSGGCYGR